MRLKLNRWVFAYLLAYFIGTCIACSQPFKPGCIQQVKVINRTNGTLCVYTVSGTFHAERGGYVVVNIPSNIETYVWATDADGKLIREFSLSLPPCGEAVRYVP